MLFKLYLTFALARNLNASFISYLQVLIVIIDRYIIPFFYFMINIYNLFGHCEAKVLVYSFSLSVPAAK